jgi:hypothetical protein
MAETEEASNSGENAPWEQGDYALGVGGFLFAEPPSDGDTEYTASSDDTKVVGLVVISQTCDIVHGSQFVAVCPLIECDEKDLADLRRGTRPSFAQLQHRPGDHVYVDLSRVMSIDKNLLTNWHRIKGFTDERARTTFAYALERKFGRFAFPDEIVKALSRLRSRIIEKHDKDSDAGKVYRSIVEVRVRVAPDWNASERKIGLIVMVRDKGDRECEFETIEKELRAESEKIRWPKGYSWDPDFPRCHIGTADSITARQLDESKALDLHYLS